MNGYIGAILFIILFLGVCFIILDAGGTFDDY